MGQLSLLPSGTWYITISFAVNDDLADWPSWPELVASLLPGLNVLHFYNDDSTINIVSVVIIIVVNIFYFLNS